MRAPPLDPAHAVDDVARVAQFELQVQAPDPADVTGQRRRLGADGVRGCGNEGFNQVARWRSHGAFRVSGHHIQSSPTVDRSRGATVDDRPARTRRRARLLMELTLIVATLAVPMTIGLAIWLVSSVLPR